MQSKDVDPEFKGGTKDIANHFLYYDKGMKLKCISSSKNFITYIGINVGESKYSRLRIMAP